MKFKTKIPDTLGFQLTPMLDVVFILLIFFVVTQQVVLDEQDIDVDVPTAVSEDDEEAKRALDEIIINAREVLENEPDARLREADLRNNRKVGDLVVKFNSKEYTPAGMTAKLKELVEANEKQPVCIRADKDMCWDKVVSVITACTDAGVYNVRFASDPHGSDKKNTGGAPAPAATPAQ